MRKLYGAAAALAVAAGLMLGATGTAQAQTASPMATHALANGKATSSSRLTPHNVQPYEWKIFANYANRDKCEEAGDRLVQLGMATQFYCEYDQGAYALHINATVSR